MYFIFKDNITTLLVAQAFNVILLYILNISKVIWFLFYFILVCLNLFRNKFY